MDGKRERLGSELTEGSPVGAWALVGFCERTTRSIAMIWWVNETFVIIMIVGKLAASCVRMILENELWDFAFGSCSLIRHSNIFQWTVGVSFRCFLLVLWGLSPFELYWTKTWLERPFWGQKMWGLERRMNLCMLQRDKLNEVNSLLKISRIKTARLLYWLLRIFVLLMRVCDSPVIANQDFAAKQFPKDGDCPIERQWDFVFRLNRRLAGLFARSSIVHPHVLEQNDSTRKQTWMLTKVLKIVTRT